MYSSRATRRVVVGVTHGCALILFSYMTNTREYITATAEPDVQRALARFIAQNESELIFIDARYRPSARVATAVAFLFASAEKVAV